MTKKRANKKAKEDNKDIVLPVIWNVPDDIITRYACNVVVQVLENELKISFFESNNEIIFSGAPRLPKEIRSDCVSSVIMHPNKIQNFIDALQQQLNVYIEREAQKKPADPKVSSPT